MFLGIQTVDSSPGVFGFGDLLRAPDSLFFQPLRIRLSGPLFKGMYGVFAEELIFEWCVDRNDYECAQAEGSEPTQTGNQQLQAVTIYLNHERPDSEIRIL